MDNLKNVLNNKIEKLYKKKKTVGYSVALFDNKEIKYINHGGYINKKDNILTNDASLFMIGSNTKVLTALAIFQLYEQGKLLLEDDIRQYIPELKIKALFDYDKITIQNLLMHRSGIQCDLYDFILDDKKEYHEIVEALENTYLTTKPGTMFAYSNIGYTLLGIIIEKISSLKYVDYIKENIGKALEIDIRFLLTQDEYDNNVSLSYDKKLQETTDYVATMLPAGSNTYMKIIDLVKIGQMFLNEGEVNGKVFLKKETIDLMKKLDLNDSIDQIVNNGGHGLLHNTDDYGEAGKVYGHGGDTMCHHSSFSFIPKQNIGAITFTNTETGIGFSRMASKICIDEYLKVKGIHRGNIKCVYKHIDEDTSKYLGKYATTSGLMEFKHDKKNNLISSLSGISVKLVPCEDGYLQCFPNKGIIKKILLSKLIKGIRFKFIPYKGEDVIVLEQASGNRKGTIIFGAKYVENTLENTLWHKALGEYNVQNSRIVSSTLKLVNINNMLKVILDLDSEKNVKFLHIINDNLAFSQGFGRDTKEAIHLEEKDGYYYLTCSGIVGTKKVEDR